MAVLHRTDEAQLAEVVGPVLAELIVAARNGGLTLSSGGGHIRQGRGQRADIVETVERKMSRIGLYNSDKKSYSRTPVHKLNHKDDQL